MRSCPTGSTTTARPATSVTRSPSSVAAPRRLSSDERSREEQKGRSDERSREEQGFGLVRVMAQMSMVMNLDKCIGCHTCSVTCKQVWTNRPGTEYVYFNNVETKPGIGYPKRYEDQEEWRGGWALDRKGRLQLKAG